MDTEESGDSRPKHTSQKQKEQQTMNAKQQKIRQFAVSFIFTLVVVGIILACLPQTRHNLTTAIAFCWATLCDLGNSPADYNSSDSMESHEQGCDPDLYGPGEERRMAENR